MFVRTYYKPVLHIVINQAKTVQKQNQPEACDPELKQLGFGAALCGKACRSTRLCIFSQDFQFSPDDGCSDGQGQKRSQKQLRAVLGNPPSESSQKLVRG